MKKGFFYFFKGVLYVVPVFITGYIIFAIIQKIGSLLELLHIRIHPLIDPFLGLILVITLIISIGYLGSSIFNPVFKLFEHYLEKAPLVKTIYSSVKDLLTAFVGEKKRFNKPVLVKMGNNIEKIGFITNESLMELGISNTKVAVYFPHSYAFSGNLFVIEKEHITPINGSSSDIMKFIVSGGVVNVE